MRKWREYCAQALSAAESVEQNAATTSEKLARLVEQNAATEKLALFKPRTSAPIKTPLISVDADAQVSSEGGSSKDAEPVAPPPSGFDWGQTF